MMNINLKFSYTLLFSLLCLGERLSDSIQIALQHGKQNGKKHILLHQKLLGSC
ncbi:hypothetical protein RE628_12520 [Paenibacillus sp. D2_2]|uniref:hypothetical protein n=1 Tax=Paenibacillus sp. D2_2 TaxID=3073092 RepID=UPI002815AE54|nr:hypothetical protein [Paenibacillus sp. D2_2]WMT43018.1 hypothetical protein RE628_12520 [Paenibacillus sp. D2_2]